MAYNTKNVIYDSEGNIVPQYYNPITDKYEVLEGLNGANKVVIFDEVGNELISNQIVQPIVDKLSELTGTAIDENTRKSNELIRVALYNQISQKLANGEFKGEKGDIGNGLEFIWNGTQLGVRVKGQTTYIYVDLKGQKGDTGSIENLTKLHVTNALGYTPPIQDTVTTINGKTGAIAKLDVVALGIPSQDTVYTHPSGTNPHGTTKSDVGLGSVDNVKQMPIAGGTFTGISKAQGNTSYTVAQIRNVKFKQGTNDFTTSELANGEIGFLYE